MATYSADIKIRMQTDSVSEAKHPSKRILLVDDDSLFRESLSQNLSNAGFHIREASSGDEALKQLHAQPNAIDLIILDWRMPGLSGLDVLRKIREISLDTPVLYLTSLDYTVFEEMAFMNGAVDYIDKSRSFKIVLKRIELVLFGGRRFSNDTHPGDEKIVRHGPLKLDTASCRAYWFNSEVPLTLSEFGIVKYISSRAGADITYRQIYDLIRGHGFASGHGPEGFRANVRTFIKRIRRKFQNIDGTFKSIENYPGFGYRWHQ